MRSRVLLVAVFLGLVLPAAAQAGCWATVQLSSVPDDVRAGDVWQVDLTVKQHGRRLLPDAKPRVTLRAPDGRTRVVPARKTTRVGVYRARVVFADPGRWSYTIFDGFVPHCGRVHTYPAVQVRP
jgi:hypothetical protein